MVPLDTLGGFEVLVIGLIVLIFVLVVVGLGLLVVRAMRASPSTRVETLEERIDDLEARLDEEGPTGTET